MLNMMCAIRIVPKPSGTDMLRKSVSSEAPRTISGDDMGRKISRFVVPRPRNPYRTSASAIRVPSAVAAIEVTAATSRETTIELRSPGTASQCRQLSSVKPCHV